MSKAILKASIKGEDGKRIELRCYRDGDIYVWREWDADGADTLVNGKTVADAKDGCIMAWGGSAWDLRADWL